MLHLFFQLAVWFSFIKLIFGLPIFQERTFITILIRVKSSLINTFNLL